MVSKLWASVIEELRCFAGLMIFIYHEWGKGWNPMVSSSDAIASMALASALCSGILDKSLQLDASAKDRASEELEDTMLGKVL